MRSPWWKRNLIWLLALPVLLTVAMVAASQRYVNIYLPWEPNAPIHAKEDVVELRQRYEYMDETVRREVDIRFLGVEQVADHEGQRPAPGATMWKVAVEFRAEPDAVLGHCDAALMSDGVSHGFGGGKVLVDPDSFTMPALRPSCEPLDTPGPQFEVYSTEVAHPEVPRPERWQREFAFVLPEGKQPDEFRVWWTPPEYASFKLDA